MGQPWKAIDFNKHSSKAFKTWKLSVNSIMANKFEPLVVKSDYQSEANLWSKNLIGGNMNQRKTMS